RANRGSSRLRHSLMAIRTGTRYSLVFVASRRLWSGPHVSHPNFGEPFAGRFGGTSSALRASLLSFAFVGLLTSPRQFDRPFPRCCQWFGCLWAAAANGVPGGQLETHAGSHRQERTSRKRPHCKSQ